MFFLLSNKMQQEQGEDYEQYVNIALKAIAFHTDQVNAIGDGEFRGMEVLLDNHVDILIMRPKLLKKISPFIWSGRYTINSG